MGAPWSPTVFLASLEGPHPRGPGRWGRGPASHIRRVSSSVSSPASPTRAPLAWILGWNVQGWAFLETAHLQGPLGNQTDGGGGVTLLVLKSRSARTGQAPVLRPGSGDPPPLRGFWVSSLILSPASSPAGSLPPRQGLGRQPYPGHPGSSPEDERSGRPQPHRTAE